MKRLLALLTVVAALFAWSGVLQAQQAAEAVREGAVAGSASAPPAVDIVQPKQRITAWVTVIAEEAQIRSGPSPRDTEIDVAYRGDEFQATGRVRGWYFVRSGDDEEGWIDSRSVTRGQVRPGYQKTYPPPQGYYPYYYDDYPYWRGSIFFPYWWGGGNYWDNDHFSRDRDYDHGHRDHGNAGRRDQPMPHGPAPGFRGPR